MEYIKCVVVGDGAVGKTALIIAYVNNSFPVDYLPTVADKFQKNVSLNGNLFAVSLWDTAGQEGYARLRSLSYSDTDVFVLCFSSVSSASFHNVRDKWLPEIRHFCPDAPCLLVGTKTDLRPSGSSSSPSEQPESEIVSPEMGQAMAGNMKLAGYAECSAKLNLNLEEVFMEVVRIHVRHVAEKQELKRKSKGGRCTLL